MGSESKASTRTIPTTNHTNTRATGIVKVIRKNCKADSTVDSHTFSSAKIDWITVYNASDVDIAINFDDQDVTLATHYRTIQPGVETALIGITKDTKMYFKKLIAGAGVKRLEITAWG